MFSYKNKKGVVYYLHKKGNLYFFSKKSEDALQTLPQGYVVVENERTGMPVLKKI